MAYTYKGTAISGQDSKAKKGHKATAKNQTYLNTSSGNVYKSTKSGSKSDKIWKYTRTDIVKKPGLGIANLCAPYRSGSSAVASWGVPGDLVSAKKGNRATGLYIQWSMDLSAWSDPSSVAWNGNPSTTSASIDLNNVTIGGKTYTRSSFHPITYGNYLKSVSIAVTPANGYGNGPGAASTGWFGIPRVPSLEPYAFNNSTGVVSIQILTNAGADMYERYDTRHIMKVTDSRDGGASTNAVDGSNTSTDYTISYDASAYQSLGYDDYIQIDTSAYSRGYAGDSAPATRRYYVAYPAQPIINDVKASEKDIAGKVTVYIDTNTENNEQHPVDGVKLEYLANVSYKKAENIPGGANWTEASASDNDKCTALTVGAGALIPDPGKYTWVRVKSYHINEEVLYRYSTPVRVKDLETPAPTAADDDITILDSYPGTDGESIVVELGWNKDGGDDSTGTELTWSDAENTWKSTEDPSKYTFTWSDGQRVVGQTTYNDSATITIKGLDESVLYYIKARRYLDGDPTTYSDYSNTATCLTSQTPTAVVVSCPGVVPNGSALPVSWVFSGTSLQTEWQIVQNTWYEESNDEIADTGRIYYEYDSVTQTYSVVTTIYELTSDVSIDPDKEYFTRTGSGTADSPYIYTPVDDPDVSDIGTYYELMNPKTEGWYVLDGGAVIASGESSIGSTQIGWDRIVDFLDDDNSVKFTVQVSTGSGFVVSDEQFVQYAEAPTLAVVADASLTAQPLSFTATSNSECDLTVILSANGAISQFPDGIKRQTENDTIYSGIFSPAWTEELSSYSTTVTLPSGLDLWDKCNYTLSVVATDTLTGLQSGEVSKTILVAWSSPAVSMAPVTTYAVTDDTAVNDDHTYYVYESNEYVVVIPDGNENPHNLGWFEASVSSPVVLTEIDTTDDLGYHRKAVQIDLTPATGCGQNDVYDIYRVTGGSAYLIGQGFPLTYTAVDEYAPFGDEMTLYYRVAIRTPDGDVAFYDYDYYASGNMMRFDWMGGMLELPYNIQIGDKYAKDVEVRKHLNGDSDAYWNQGVDHNGSLNSDLIRLEQQDDVDRARQLAQYPGAVFVRTPDGSAYEADVQVTDLSTDGGSLEAISIDAREIALTSAFVLPTPFAPEDDEE